MAVQRDPIHEWRERLARLVLNVDFKPLSDAPFHAAIEPILEGITRTAHSPGVTFRDDALVRDGNDAYSLLISQSRNLEVTHRRCDLPPRPKRRYAHALVRDWQYRLMS